MFATCAGNKLPLLAERLREFNLCRDHVYPLRALSGATRINANEGDLLQRKDGARKTAHSVCSKYLNYSYLPPIAKARP